MHGLELDEDLIAFLIMWITCLPLHWFIISHHSYTNVIYVDLFPCTLFCPIVFLFMHWYHTLLITTDLKWVSVSLSGSQEKLLSFSFFFSPVFFFFFFYTSLLSSLYTSLLSSLSYYSTLKISLIWFIISLPIAWKTASHAALSFVPFSETSFKFIY